VIRISILYLKELYGSLISLNELPAMLMQLLAFNTLVKNREREKQQGRLPIITRVEGVYYDRESEKAYL
jgi:hypothetical protein